MDPRAGVWRAEGAHSRSQQAPFNRLTAATPTAKSLWAATSTAKRLCAAATAAKRLQAAPAAATSTTAKRP